MHHSSRQALGLVVAGFAALSWQTGIHNDVAERFSALSRESSWTLVRSVPVGFRAHHPQGMVKIDDTFFVSSVEITTRTRRFDQPVDGYDRDTGAGIGHLFKIDKNGDLIGDLRLGEGTIYHPGGIDYDGKDIWVAVAEYRPNSRSIVYRIDPATMKATEVFRVDDHIGGVVRDVEDGTLHGVSWGSRRFYRWTLDNPGAPRRTMNSSHYVDYQDCQYAGRHRMLCGGIAELPRGDGQSVRLGGIDLVSLGDGRPLHQVPVALWTRGGSAMTRNPLWLEPHANGLRAYFMPEDDAATIYVYDVAVKPAQ